MCDVLDTPARLLTLLSLLQTPREWPGGELATRLRVSRRTVRRDVDRLRELGYPVRATMGAEGGYRLTAGAAMPPLLLDDEEAVAIAVGLRTAARHPVQGIEQASARAMAKLRQVLPARLRRRVDALHTATEAPAAEDPGIDPEVLAVLAAAATAGERLRFRYRPSEPDGEPTDRRVEPHRLVTVGRRWYLVAFDTDRDDWRIFRVDRVDAPTPAGTLSPPRTLPADDAVAFVTGKLYTLRPTYRAVATVHAPSATVSARFTDGAAEIEPLGPDRCRLRSSTDTLEWLAFRLVLLGCEVEVHEPPELRGYLSVMGGRALRAAADPAAPPPR